MVERGLAAEPVPLQDRRTELGTLEDHLRALARGQGAVILIEGREGSGKTRLLDEAALRARRHGVPLLRGSAAAGRAAAFGPLLEALATVGRPVPDEATVRRMAGRADPRVWMMADVERRLAHAAARTPLVVALDDVQDFDDATLLALRTLPGRLAGHAVLWLLALAPGRADLTAQALRRAGASVLSLAPLAREAVRALAHEILHGAPSEPVLDLMQDLDGHPSSVVELLQAFVVEGLVEVADGRARLTGHGLRRALCEAGRRRTPAASPTAERFGLTKAELAVAELVAQGATNRQAAERLFLSPHTVSSHLRHTFEKLGIRSRVELAVLFAGHPSATE